MFDNLKKLEVAEATSWIDLPEIGKGARVCVKFAGESNTGYFNGMLRLSGSRIRHMAKLGGAVEAADLALSREDDRQLFPRYIFVNWESIPADGEMCPFSLDNAKEFCKQLPNWIFDKIRNHAATPERFLQSPAPNAADLSGN